MVHLSRYPAVTTATRRRDYRYLATVGVALLLKDGPVDCLTADASYRGVFVLTAAPLRLRALVRVRLTLPDGPLAVHAVVVNVVPAGEGRSAGAGISFFGLAGEAQRRWETFIDDQYVAGLDVHHASAPPGRRSAPP